MLIAAAEPSSEGVVGYFEVNFPARDRGEYTFMWRDGRIRKLQVLHLHGERPDVEAPIAAFDVASGFVMVREP
jgi:hypothetical protein